MQDIPFNIEEIFRLTNNDAAAFEQLSLKVFHFQYKHNEVYHEFCRNINTCLDEVRSINDIPFLPISFFKTHQVKTNKKSEIVFTSSGTGNKFQSKHFVYDNSIYETAFLRAFELFYGKPSDYCILALLPGYLEREGSSLIYMVDDLIKRSENEENGFFLHDFKDLKRKLIHNEERGIKTLLIGVSFALMDFADAYPMDLKHTLVMETGGMKGRRKEITRNNLHSYLQKQFHLKEIHSEYGMAELLSQAYAKRKGVFLPSPWMKILIRQLNDPFSFEEIGRTGGINIIDLANIYSCSFIETQDLGRVLNAEREFEILGRFDNSDIRGCNLMVE